MDRLESMAVFVAAAEGGSFAAVSGRLGMSPQMVGKHVSFLEERLDTRLLNRTTRRQSLTEFGRSYHERCKLILGEVAAADGLADGLGEMPRGQLRINAPVTFGTHSLMPVVTRYLRAYPGVDVAVTLNDRLVDLVDEGFDAVVRIGPLPDSSLVARKLAPYRLVSCASPTYLAERGTPGSPEELAEHECLKFAYWSPALADTWRFSRGRGEEVAIHVRGRLQVNTFEGLLVAALNGCGVILGPVGVLEREFASGRLVRLLPEFDGPSRPMHVVYLADRRPTAKLRGFIDAVVEAFGTSA